MRKTVSACAGALALVLIIGPAARADHTNPQEPLSPTEDPGTTELITRGEGTWEFIRNFPPNPGTDLKFFRTKDGRLFAAAGTLGQGNEGHVGSRIIQLLDAQGEVAPEWVADHGSANCTPDNTGVTSLQHDQAVTPKKRPRLLIDTTDTVGRCHDDPGGGLEFIAIQKIHRKRFKAREIHLTRHVGTSHTVTVDATRPWIVYNNSSQASGAPWIDVLDIRTCLNKELITIKDKRSGCRPEVYRIVFKPEWAQRIDGNGDRVEGTEASCHDITAKPGRIYCANLNSTIVINVKNLTDDNGNIRGKPIKCQLADGTNTTAKVTDCSNIDTTGTNEATGWKYVGHINHAGRNLNNLNTEYTVREQISVSHEAEPTPDKKWMFVTDERGGGIVPGGASCQNENENPYGNGGVHVIDISQGGEYDWAKTPDGDKAVFIGEVVVPQATFCTAHVMEQIKGEQRFVIAWYSQGTKIVDWFVDDRGRWTFREIASVVPQNPTTANTWTSEVFKKVKNDDGTMTYYIMTSDISRGIDIMSWTGPRNPNGTPPPTGREIKQRVSGI